MLDVDGVVIVVRRERLDEVLDAVAASAPSTSAPSGRSCEAGALSYDLDGLRKRVEGE